LPKIVKKSTDFSQESTKNARFLQKNHKKYQFFTIFLPQMRRKPTHLRQIVMALPGAFRSTNQSQIYHFPPNGQLKNHPQQPAKTAAKASPH
jgi:pyruvate-formate lyase-activating enzyme